MRRNDFARLAGAPPPPAPAPRPKASAARPSGPGGRGPAPLPPGEGRTAQLQVRITADEHAALARAAERAGVAVSTLVRRGLRAVGVDVAGE